MKRILIVVHRTYPYPGGSEVNVHNIGTEMVHRGYQVTVLADTHKGDDGKIRVTSDEGELKKRWDLILVHGGDERMQMQALSTRWDSPTMYWLLEPGDDFGFDNVDLLGCSRPEHIKFAQEYGAGEKIAPVRFSISFRRELSRVERGFFRKYFAITTKKLVVSVGGFWEHKGMHEFRRIFTKINPPDTTLCLTGYAKRDLAPKEAPNVRVFPDFPEHWTLRAIMDADLYVMNSSHEGFGLVLLEAMINRTPWAARNVGGAPVHADFGHVYETPEQLGEILMSLSSGNFHSHADAAYERIKSGYLSSHTVDDIELAMNWR